MSLSKCAGSDYPSSIISVWTAKFSLNFCEWLVFFSVVKFGIFNFGMGLRELSGAKARD